MSVFLQSGRPPLILASTSKSRARILEAAGLAFIVEPPGVDESVMRQAVSGERSLEPHDVAELLARAKQSDVIDAALVLLAEDGDHIITSDPDDIEPLALASGRHVELIRS